MLLVGDPVPSFFVRGVTNPRFSFDSAAGRYIVVTFLGSGASPGAQAFLAAMHAETKCLDDRFACAFIVTNDPRDEQSGLLTERQPGIRLFLDFDLEMATLFGAVGRQKDNGSAVALMTWILDPGMRVLRILPINDLATHYDDICAALDGQPAPKADMDAWAPILVVPNVLEPDFCHKLITYAETVGLNDSGYMKTDPKTGETVQVLDHVHKRRSDCSIDDEQLRNALKARIRRRLVPPIARAFQFTVSRMERYIVARYDSKSGGHFRPHKDNTTLGTAHRRFAVSIGLDADRYEGGDLRFPEFGPRTYRPPTGGAIIFSCSLLHEVLPVTSGERYAVLPFLYDEAAAQIRLENAKHLQDAGLRENVIQSVTGDSRPKAE